LSLEEDEALAVSLALGTMASSSVSGGEEAALRALVKLERVLPARLRRRATTLRSSILPLERSGPRVDAGLLSILAVACEERRTLCFRYIGRDGQASEREVEPAGIVLTGYRWYLVAWDAARRDWRTFRIDRIQGGARTGEAFTPRPPPDDGDLRAYVSRNVSTAVYGHRARIVLHAPLAAMKERVSPAAGVLERIDDDRCMLVAGGQTLDALAFWISMIGVDFEVREPRELIDHLRALSERTARSVARSDAPQGSRASTANERSRRARRAGRGAAQGGGPRGRGG
jgi:predicted DNA-binding transcriptional regulator YafY